MKQKLQTSFSQHLALTPQLQQSIRLLQLSSQELNQELEQALLAQLQRLREEPVGEAELERIRNQLIAAKVYEKDSVYAQARQIGSLETIGLGWELMDQYVEHLSRITPEQIQAVANKYLVPENLTIAVLDPQGQTAPPTAAMLPGGLANASH